MNLSGHERILLAVSGGIDSTVMAHLFHQSGLRFAIAHCNFYLRGKESEEDAVFVKKLANKFNVPFYLKKFETSAFASGKGISIQMAARELRYDWFEEIRAQEKFDLVATAHHLDDQVETFLINLIRGTGIAGLHGIPIKNGSIIRPMMFAYRKDIEQFATQHKIPFRTDLSNHETKYLRNKLRHEVIPILCSINPEIQKGVTGTIKRLAEFEKIGDRVVKDWLKSVIIQQGGDTWLNIGDILKMDPPEPFLWEFISGFGFNETQAGNMLASLDKNNRRVFHATKYKLVKDKGQLVISLIEHKKKNKEFKINIFIDKMNLINPIELSFTRVKIHNKYEIPVTIHIASLDFDKLQFPLTLRKWKDGDSFYPLGMNKKKKLSDFFIDQKIPVKEKENTWLLVSGCNILWIIGHRIDDRYKVTAATKEVLCVVQKIIN
jgi:tRNA(Ile)-lysidine synthase